MHFDKNCVTSIIYITLCVIIPVRLPPTYNHQLKGKVEGTWLRMQLTWNVCNQPFIHVSGVH